MEIELEIDRDLFRVFPDLQVSGFLVKDLNISAEQLAVDLPRAELPLSLTLENLTTEPRITRWREAMQVMNLKPSTHKSSIEQLVRRRLKGDEVRTPLSIVNLYCQISTAAFAPLGGYDVERLPLQSVNLRFANPESDRFAPLAGRTADMPLKPSVVVYASGNEILCWALNHRDSRTSSLHQGTRVAAFFSEAVADVHQGPMKNAIAELRSRLVQLGAQASEPQLASQDNPRTRLLI